jgi:O-antigen ligase
VPTTSNLRLPTAAIKSQLGQPGPFPHVRGAKARRAADAPSFIPAFLLFIVVNAVLLIRPAEIFPQLQGIELYFFAILACSLCAAGDVLRYLIDRPLHTQPITLCLFGLLVAVLLPQMVVLNFGEAWTTGFHFFKNIVYFLLFVSLVNTLGRLRVFLACLLLIAAVVLVVAVLDYHQIAPLSTLKAARDTEVGSWGEVTEFDRLQFTGIFNDPNEVCVWLATLLPLVLGGLLRDRDVLRRGLWLGLLILFGYGIFLTRSRGGFLAMVVGLGVAVLCRYGRQRAALVAAIGLPVVLLLFAGRQTDLGTSVGTGQTRVQIWSDWLNRFRENPLVGEGMNLKNFDPEQIKEMKRLGIDVGHLAHNSFLQAFADVGFCGGCLFLGAFGVALWSLWRVGRPGAPGAPPIDPAVCELQPFLLGATSAYCVGMLTLSLWVLAPTYVVLALAASYPRARGCPPPVRFDVNLLDRFALAGIAYLGAMYLFVRLFVNWG